MNRFVDDELIHLLQKAYAVEIGAYEAYDHHYKSLPRNSYDRGDIKFIQVDELIHREKLGMMLAKLDASPDHFLNGTFYLIGKIMGLSCYVLPFKYAMLGAKVIEKLGGRLYLDLIDFANLAGQTEMAETLTKIHQNEKEHEEMLSKMYTRGKPLEMWV